MIINIQKLLRKKIIQALHKRKLTEIFFKSIENFNSININIKDFQYIYKYCVAFEELVRKLLAKNVYLFQIKSNTHTR